MLFDELRSQVESASSPTTKQRLIRAFASANESPVVEDTVATFYHIVSEATEVDIEGDWTNWQPSAPMARLEDTHLWYRVERFPLDARLEYRILVNGHPRLDPRNTHIAPSAFGPHSELRMPQYKAPPEVWDDSRVPAGKLTTHWLASHALGDRHTFWVYVPPEFNRKVHYPVAYMNDGGDYVRYAEFPRLADHMIALRVCVPFIAVLIKPNERTAEYAANRDYARFVSDELVPWVDSTYPTIQKPSGRALVGASFGGLAAAHTALESPDIFGAVAGQSGFYSYDGDALIKEFESTKPVDVRFHLVVGQYETDLGGEEQAEMNFVAAQQRFAQVLHEKKYKVECSDHPEGHQWYFWRAYLGEAFRFFWGAPKKASPAHH